VKIEVDAKNVSLVNGIFTIDIDENVIKDTRKPLSSFKNGTIIKGNTDRKYIAFRQLDNASVYILRKDLLDKTARFDPDNNNFATSEIMKMLNSSEYLDELAEDFGLENIVPYEVDLLSLDGLDDYGKCEVRVGLLTLDDYRWGRKNKIPHMVIGDPYWLATPGSTSSGISSSFVLCVRSDGYVGYDDCSWNGLGVRPFFILKSDIFVSEVI